MQSLGVPLVLEFKAKDKTEEIQIRSWKPNQDGWINMMKFKSEIEIKSKRRIERDGEKWKLKKLWVQKAEGDKSGNEETWI